MFSTAVQIDGLCNVVYTGISLIEKGIHAHEERGNVVIVGRMNNLFKAPINSWLWDSTYNIVKKNAPQPYHSLSLL